MGLAKVRVNATRGSRWLLAATGILIALSIPWAFLGIVGLAFGIGEATRTCDPTFPICRNFASYEFALAAVGLVIGGVHLFAGVGTWGGSSTARRLAWAVATIGALGAFYLAITSVILALVAF